MFFNKRNHSSKFNELKIMIENSNQVVKPATSHANAHPKVDLFENKLA